MVHTVAGEESAGTESPEESTEKSEARILELRRRISCCCCCCWRVRFRMAKASEVRRMQWRRRRLERRNLSGKTKRFGLIEEDGVCSR
ncbi:hypothetical protein E2542_SST28757 [Spatholobus suberectus]|nr:hypothetical protein E2542_SST28757 [Spatholobus suberectus]